MELFKTCQRMKQLNKRKLLKKEIKFVHESMVHHIRRSQRDKIKKHEFEREMGRVARELSLVVSTHCGVRKQKTKRRGLQHYIFQMSNELVLFIHTSLPLTCDLPLLSQGIMSSLSIPTLIGLMGCGEKTRQHIAQQLPVDFVAMNIGEKTLSVPLLTSIIHKHRNREREVMNKEDYLSRTLEEHQKIKSLKRALTCKLVKAEETETEDDLTAAFA